MQLYSLLHTLLTLFLKTKKILSYSLDMLSIIYIKTRVYIHPSCIMVTLVIIFTHLPVVKLSSSLIRFGLPETFL